MTDSDLTTEVNADRLSELDDIGDCEYDESFCNIPDAEPLYSGSPITITATLAVLLSWFTSFPGISKQAFGHLLFLLHHFILPENNLLPSSYSDAADMIKHLLVPAKKYDCCVNDCIIYRGIYSDSKRCPKCNENRYSNGTTPRKVFKYLPLGPRIRRLFGNTSTSQLLQSHQDTTATRTVSDIHETDTWKKRYRIGGIINGDPRGLSLALCADGTNPFAKERSSYSMCPIVISILNLPSHLRRLSGFLQLVGIIPGKFEPKNTDPYLGHSS